MKNRRSLPVYILLVLALGLLVGATSGCASRPIVEFPIVDHYAQVAAQADMDHTMDVCRQ